MRPQDRRPTLTPYTPEGTIAIPTGHLVRRSRPYKGSPVAGYFPASSIICREHPIHQVGGLAPHMWQHMAVQIQRRRDLSMSKNLLNDFRMDVLGEQEGGTAVP